MSLPAQPSHACSPPPLCSPWRRLLILDRIEAGHRRAQERARLEAAAAGAAAALEQPPLRQQHANGDAAARTSAQEPSSLGPLPPGSSRSKDD